MYTKRLNRGLAVALAAAFGISTPGVVDAAPADPGPIPTDVSVLGSAGDWTRFEGPYGWVYGSPASYGDRIFVIANGAIEDVCAGNPAVNFTGRLRQRSDGKWVLRDTVDQQMAFTTVYPRPDGIDDIFEWFGMVCPAIGGGETPPKLLASGQAEITFDSVMESPYWFTFDENFPQPAGWYTNGVEGVLETPDGERVRLITTVTYRFAGEGIPDFGRDYMRLKPIG